MNWVKIFTLIFSLWVGGCASMPTQVTSPLSSPRNLASARYELKLMKSTLSNGDLVRVRLRFFEPPTTELNAVAQFEGKKALFFPLKNPKWDPSQPVFEAWLGVPYERESGESAVDVEIPVEGGVKVEKLPVSIRKGQFPTQSLKVDPEIVDPNPENQARIEREAKETRAIYAQSTPQRFWSGSFRLPLHSEIRSTYGIKRVFNGKPTGYHAGLDFRAPMNSSVPAAASGRVALAKNLFVCGNGIILDHGFGVYSVYCHLNKIKVKEGDLVKKSQIIGLSGTTGRSTGPHLHWGALVGGGVYINPKDTLMGRDRPKEEADQ